MDLIVGSFNHESLNLAHSSMVNVFSSKSVGSILTHIQCVSILPAGKRVTDFWAGGVGLSRTREGSADAPRYLYASSRGFEAGAHDYVAIFALEPDGTISKAVFDNGNRLGDAADALHVWKIQTSIGIANAIELAPWPEQHDSMDFLALTDAEQSSIATQSFDGSRITEVARTTPDSTTKGNM